MILHVIRFIVLASVIAYIVWIVRSFNRKRYRTGTVLVLVGLLVVSGAVFCISKLLGVTDPFIIESLSVSPAAPDAIIGYSIDGNVLSVVSSNDVVCVADPGISFQYVVVWLVPLPPATPMQELRVHKYGLPKYADPDHINGLDAEVPADIAEVASDNKWR